MYSGEIGIIGKIIEIIPVSGYQDKVYTQNVIVELENGKEVALSDTSMMCKKDDQGINKRFIVFIQVSKPIEKNNEKDLKIIPHIERGPSAELYGHIEEIITENLEYLPYAILSIGIGKIGLFLNRNIVEKFRKGDHVIVKGARLDLMAISTVKDA